MAFYNMHAVLMVAITRPNFLTKYLGNEDLTEADRDSYRAKVIRQKLSK